MSQYDWHARRGKLRAAFMLFSDACLDTSYKTLQDGNTFHNKYYV